MSRSVLRVTVVIAVALATLIAPAAALPVEVGGVALSPAEGWAAPSASASGSTPAIYLAGDGNCSGAGTCPG